MESGTCRSGRSGDESEPPHRPCPGVAQPPQLSQQLLQPQLGSAAQPHEGSQHESQHDLWQHIRFRQPNKPQRFLQQGSQQLRRLDARIVQLDPAVE
jgi:hypothetical protein